MSKDSYTKFEEDNWNSLAEKFIKEQQELWMELVEKEYDKAQNYDPEVDR